MVVGQGACFGMAGFPCFLGLMVPFLGLLMLLRVHFTWLKLLLVATLLVLLLRGVFRMVLMQKRLLLGCLMPLWSWIRSLVSLLLVLGCLLTSLITAGVTAGGAMLIVFCWIACLILAGVLCLLLDLCRLYKELNCGGSDNLGVVRHVGRLLDGDYCSSPFELVTDGDLLVLIRRMLDLRGRDTVRITKVKGHADEGMVLDGRVRELDRLGNNAADEAADFGRRRVGPAVIDARRNLFGVCGRCYPVILDLHRFFIAISWAVVNHDGNDGTAPAPMVWFAGALPKRRRLCSCSP